MSLLDPVIIAQLGNLQLRSRRILDGFYAGHHLNKNRGQAQDFSEHRPYYPGDEPRSIDWKVFGRTDRMVIKQYEEQTNVQATIFFDHSNSMSFSHAGRLSKLEYAKTLAAAIGTLVVSQTDAIGFVSHSNSLSAGSHPGQLGRLYEILENIQPQGSWDAAALLKKHQTLTRKRGFVIVFSDLMTSEAALMSSLRILQAQRNEVLVFQILDPAELELPFDGPVQFEDLETGAILTTEPAAIREKYKAWVSQHLAHLSQSFRGAGIEYARFQTDVPFDRGLGAYLSWRGARF